MKGRLSKYHRHRRPLATRLTLAALVLAFGWSVGFASAARAIDTEITGDNADRRNAILSFYAHHIAKLDARVSFCDGARANYRAGFEEVVSGSGTTIFNDVMKSYDDRYENFIAGIGDYDCPAKEISHYRNRQVKQIKNLNRDLAALN